MKNFGNRIRQAWATLRGRIYIPPPAKVIYVEHENRRGFVQLAYYEGDMLALDAEGNLWCIRREFGPGAYVCQFVMKAPELR